MQHRRNKPPYQWARNLRDARCKMLWTQRRLAKESGVSQVTIALVECGHRYPRALTRQLLANAVGKLPAELFPENPPKE